MFSQCNFIAVAAGAKMFFGGRKQTESTGDLVQAPWSFFFLHPNALWTGICKDKTKFSFISRYCACFHIN